MTETKHRPLRIGINLLPWTGGMAGETPRWSEVLAMAERYEQPHFDSRWLSDHFLLNVHGIQSMAALDQTAP